MYIYIYIQAYIHKHLYIYTRQDYRHVLQRSPVEHL